MVGYVVVWWFGGNKLDRFGDVWAYTVGISVYVNLPIFPFNHNTRIIIFFSYIDHGGAYAIPFQSNNILPPHHRPIEFLYSNAIRAKFRQCYG